jgi:drug/metabolite transporter (DMT)-like permease
LIVLAYLLLCLCWSTTWQAIRLCLLGYPPLIGAALRFLLATLLLILIHALVQLRRAGATASAEALYGPNKHSLRVGQRQHLALAGAGLFNGLGYACIYIAEQTLSGGTTAVLCATSPLFTLVLARVIGLEALLLRRLLGMMISLVGVGLLFSDGLGLSRDHFRAMLLAGCAAAFLWPCYGALLKRYAQDIPPLISTSYFLFYTALTLAVLSLLRGEQMPTLRTAPIAAHLGLFYLTVMGSVVAWTVYLWLLQRLDLSLLSTLGLLQPVMALGLDLLLHEAQLRPRGYLGTALVVIGMALSTRRVSRDTTRLAA